MQIDLKALHYHAFGFGCHDVHPSRQSKVISIWLQKYMYTNVKCFLANDCNLAIIWPKFTSFTFLFVYSLQMLPLRARPVSALVWLGTGSQRKTGLRKVKSLQGNLSLVCALFMDSTGIKPRECLLLNHQSGIMKDLIKDKDTRRRRSRNSAWDCVSTLRWPLQVLL